MQCGRPGLDPWVGKTPWRRERLPTPVFWPRELDSIVHGVPKSGTQLSDFNFHFLMTASQKEISPGISLEGMRLKLKLQYFGHLMRRVDSLENSDAGRDWGQEEKGTTEDEMAGWHH